MLNGTNIKFQYKFKNKTKTKSMKLNANENLENNFKTNQNENQFANQKNYEFHLLRNKTKNLLDKNKKTKELDLKEGDIILVSLKNTKNEIKNTNHSHNESSANINEEISSSTERTTSRHFSSKKGKYILLIILIALIFFAGCFLIFYFIFENSKTNNNKYEKNNDKDNKPVIENTEEIIPQIEPNFTKEDLAVNKSYPPDRLFIFTGQQLTEMKIEGDNITEDNSYHNFSKSSDFLFITRAAYIEKNNETLIEKEWYVGYIAIYNLIIPNKTHDNYIIFDQEINNYLNRDLIKFSDREQYYAFNKSNFCFAKIEFYQNGELRNIYLPEGFLLNYYSYIEEIVKLLIPKISSNLYVANIEDELNKITKLDKEYNMTDNEDILMNDDEELNLEQEQDNNRLRNLNIKNIKKNYLKNIYTLRKISDNDNSDFSDISNITDYNNSNYSEISCEVEDYLNPPLTKSINYVLRQTNIINYNQSYINNYYADTESTSMYTTDLFNNEVLNTNFNNYSNLTEFSIKGIETDEVNMEGSSINTTIYSLIDNKGFLQSVIEKSTSLMKAPEDDEEENDEETDILYSQIYNSNNQVELSHVKENSTEKIPKNNISFGISYFYTNSSNIINCTEHFINKEINNKLYNYFDSFKYELYNDTKNIINNISEIEEDNRLLSEEENKGGDAYYGIKKITYVKQLYKYNLIGMKMEGQMYTEIDSSTGKLNVYSIMSFGNKNSKIKVKDQISNTHLILERSNQMAYNLLLLINQTNNELMDRTDKYSEIIIEFENNFTEFFKNYSDYSNIFRESLNNMYNQVQNFSGLFFYELIALINRTYYNYTIILEDIKNEQYDFINQIRNITKEEYISYIYNMLELLENFENKTLIFLDDMNKELEHIDDFQIDLLYDIIDQLYESKQIFLKFNRNLFKSIEKGILTFKCDINDYIDSIIGQLLYITDFLAVNINKNDILIKAIDESTRADITIKLKAFRNIIITIMELLTSNINNDFESEMNVENNKSIKYISNEKALEFLNNVENKSKKTIDKIKSYIENIDIFESYSENIDVINNINNKTFIEYINDFYSNVIYQILNIKPEYLNETNDIIINKKLLLDLSKNITNIINKEIIEINDYIISYTNQYKEKNIYKIYYNLYYFRQYFLNNEMSKLLNEFYLLLNRTIKVHFKEMIDYNFNLANQVFDEENAYFTKYRGEDRRFLTSEFVERYYKYKAKFEEYLYLTFSDEFLNLLEKYFYKLKTDILNHIITKLFSVDVYYFNQEYYNKTFYFHEQINNEILRLIYNINNYYNELKLDGDIKIKAINLAQEILKPYHNKKIDDLDKYYDRLYDRTTNYHIREDEKDFVYSYWRFFKGWKNIYIYTKHYKNIDKVLKDLKKTDNYLSTETKAIYNNFISKFDKYLNNYISYCQNLYTHLFQYVENKINRSSTKSLIDKYFDNFSKLIENDSCDRLVSKIYNKEDNIRNNISIYIDKFSDNIKLLKELYYNSYYSTNNNKFLEYPEEIVYKIEQFYNESKFNIDNIKSVINNIYKNRINYIIKTTNIFINNFLRNHINYIKININSSCIINKYYATKCIELDNLYNNCIYKTNTFVIKDNDIYFLDNNSYDKKITVNTNYIKNFISFLENEINNTFLYEICENNTGPFNNETICYKEKKKFDSRFNKYNYNIIKIRNGIYYSKTLLENIDSLFDEYNFHNIIDKNKITLFDQFVNDKNILDIYDKTNIKIKNFNEESEYLVNDTYEYFLEDFKSRYTFKNDYLPFEKKMKEILQFKDERFKSAINDILNNTFEGFVQLMNEFNQSLLEQISLRDNYTYYNYNETYFKSIYNSYKSYIKNIFIQTHENVTNLNKSNYIFLNSLKTTLDKLQTNKREYFKTIINNFSQSYDFKLVNITYNLGEKIEKFMEKEYIDYEFNFIYNYVEIFENYTQNYINKNNEKIISLEKQINSIFDNIYLSFYNEFKNNASHFLSYDFIQNLKYNQSKCEKYINYSENYSLFYSEINDNKYKNISYNINYTYLKCFNKNFENGLNNTIYNHLNNNMDISLNDTFDIYLNDSIDIYISDTNDNNDDYLITIFENDNITLNEKIFYILNISNNCSDELSSIKNNSYFKETLDFMECFTNNYYIINYTYVYFYIFNDTIKENLDNIFKEMNSLFIKNRIDENFLIRFLDNYFVLDSYEEIDLADISYDFEDIESMIHYINQMKDDEYKKYLYNLLVTSINKSYTNFVNNFILDEIINDIIISINNKLELHLDFMSKKIKDEYNFYLLILNTTDELGLSSKNALINLYEKIKNKLNEIMFNLFEDDINFYLDLFYRENKKMFRDNFMNYYFRDKNDYDIKIYKIIEISDEFILDLKFNQTLDEISNHLFKNAFIKKIKEKINNSINTKVQKFYTEIDVYKNSIIKILNNKHTRPLPTNMIHLNELIINYTKLVNNQKNRYYLNISDEPFNILYEFIHNHLEPPLAEIKNQYNSIEERLLNELINILNSFPDYYQRVQEILDLENMNQNLTFIINNTNNTFFDYIEILDNDIKSYINKLIHFTYINGLYYQDSPCVGSNCFNFSEIMDNDDNIRRLEKKENGYNMNRLFDYSFFDREKINKLKNKRLRNLEKFDSTMGSISENDINSYILDMQTILNDFNRSYLNSEFKNINKFSKSYFDKVNNTFLFRLKRSIDMVGIRFSTIFTEESMHIFESKLYEQYNDITIYINSNSDIIEQTKNDFIDTLNSSSFLLDIIFNISHMKINNYYQMLYESIQDKLKYIDEDDDDQNNMFRLLSTKIKEEEEDENEPVDVDIPQIPKYVIKKVKDKVGDGEEKIEVYLDNKKYESFWEAMFKEARKSIFTKLGKGESRFDLALNQLRSYCYDKKNELTWAKIKKNIESVFKKFKVDISVGGTCTLESCNLMINFCLNLFNLKLEKFVFPIKLLPYLECAISIIPTVKSEICVGLGPNFDFKDSSKNSFDVDISGGASVGVTLDFGVYYPSLKSPVRLSLNVGLVGILGSGKAGVKLSFYYKSKFKIDLYYEFKAFELSFYVMFTLTFEIKIMGKEISFSFSFYIFNKPLGGFKNERHNEKIYTYSKSKLIEKNRLLTKNGGSWGRKKINDVEKEIYELL